MRIQVEIKGQVPLLMNNIRSANKRDPLVREKDKLQKANKARAYTDERQDQIDRLAWQTSLYEHDGRVVVLADMLLACMISGARLSRQGKDVERAGFYTDEAHYPLQYDGPRDLDKLYADGRFVDKRMGCLQGRSKILVVRPVFPAWSLAFDLTWDEEIVDRDVVERILEAAGLRCGIGTWRPRFGRFEVVSVK